MSRNFYKFFYHPGNIEKQHCSSLIMLKGRWRELLMIPECFTRMIEIFGKNFAYEGHFHVLFGKLSFTNINV